VKLSAIAFLVVRTAVRSRLLLCLVGFLIPVLVGLPLAVEGDGTAAGEIRVLLEYTLGLSLVILGVGALVFSCGAVAREIEERHIQLVVVKPVRTVEIWLGKWLGMLIVNAILLCIVGIAVYGGIRWALRSGHYDEAEHSSLKENLLTGRRQILPLPDDPTSEAVERLDQLTDGQSGLATTRREELFLTLKRHILAERATVAPGGSKTWVFPGSQSMGAERQVRLRFTLAPTVDRSLLAGAWHLGTASKTDAATVSMADALNGGNYIEVPQALCGSGEPLLVTYRNAEAGQTGTVVFDIGTGVELLVSESGFEANLLRSFLVLFFHLAALSALGLTAGCLFSSPVAGFLSAALVFVALMGHYVTLQSVVDTPTLHEEQIDGIERSRVSVFLEGVGERIVKKMEIVVEPVAGLNPLPPLADGRLVAWTFTGKALALLGLLYPAVFGAVGTWALWKRELALPGE